MRKKQLTRSRAKLVFGLGFLSLFLLLLLFTVIALTRKNSFFLQSFAQELQKSSEFTHGPLVGAVTDTSAVVWARVAVSQSTPLTLRFGTDASAVVTGGTSIPPGVQMASFNSISYIPYVQNPWDSTWKATLANLSPDTVYYYAVFQGDMPLQTAAGTFKTFPSSYTDEEFIFVYLTDFSRATTGYNTFRSVDEDLSNFAFALIGGDFWHVTVMNFSDSRKEYIDNMRNQFKQQYALSGGEYSYFHSFLSRLPLVHFYDDHDMGKNNIDGTFKWKKEAVSILKEFFPVYQEESMNNGFWQKFTYANADFFVLDVRSQRSPTSMVDLSGKTMLGEEQMSWLKAGLKESSAKWKFVITGVVFNPTHKKTEAWYSYQTERNKLVNFIRGKTKDNTKPISGVIFISGDSHGGAIDDGTNSSFPELLSPGPQEGDCWTSPVIGTWSHGHYGEQKEPCQGYATVRVLTNPDRVFLRVNDQNGEKKLKLRYFLYPKDEEAYANLIEDE